MKDDSMTPLPTILDLRSSAKSFSLAEELAKGLEDGQPRIVPGERPEDRSYAYSRRITSMVHYSDRGLEIYDEITKLKEYYVFQAELEILRDFGDEIACRMFGLPADVLGADSPPPHHAQLPNRNGMRKNEEKQEQDKKDEEDPDPSRAANGEAAKEKWGSKKVGTNNYGVNGGLNGSSSFAREGLAVELGSGSLAKTRYLLSSLSKLLKAEKVTATKVATNGESTKPSLMSYIEYKALDLEPKSLLESLNNLRKHESDTVTLEARDDTPRVHASGLAASYDDGLAYLQKNASKSVPKSLLWLGSSIGNFTRTEAAAFLKNLADNVLNSGDTLVLGIDGCNDGELISLAYNDPHGVTARFILEGLDNAGRILHCDDLKSDNFEYVSRWNDGEGRHEAYIRCKVQDLKIRLPAYDGYPQHVVSLKKNELINVEFSYKYSQVETLTLLNAAGLRLIQQWQDSRKLHSIYLVEKAQVYFPSTSLPTELSKQVSNPYGLPSLEEWEMLWKAWDMVTLKLIPKELLMKKPIDLRHIILFYLGHIPGFRDIHISRYLNEPLTEPEHFANLFERGIDPDVNEKVTKHWHSEVPKEDENWPSFEVIMDYADRIRTRTRNIYKTQSGDKMTRRLARVLMMVYEHEAMHMETLVYICLQACTKLNVPETVSQPDFKSLGRYWNRMVEQEGSERQRVLEFSEIEIDLGHDDDDTMDSSEAYDPMHEYGWDVENPKRKVHVEKFKISALPVSNQEYLNFLQKTAGVAVKERLVPSSWNWEAKSSGPLVKTLYGDVSFENAAHWPVCGSAEQLGAYAKSKGGRLPTQEEICVFFQHHPVDSAGGGDIGFNQLHPVPARLPQKGRDGIESNATSGGVWMWTSTILDAHPGYKSSNLYPGYSSDFHDGQHQIIIGGSYVTIPRLARRTFVNWYQEQYPYVIAGARVVYD